MEPITEFNSLPLPEAVKTALASQGIETPSPIQAQAIPAAMNGKDVVGLAQTGTGKTLAFCLPLITALDKAENENSTALILAPTREIAIQVTEVIKALTTEMKGRWTPLLVIGGVGMKPQIDGLAKKPRLIVATPGRLVDHMREGVAKLDNVNFLVLDEADRMLDMGFAPQLNEILRGLPKERQTMLFSATFPREIEEISSKYLRSPQRIEVGAGQSKVVDSVSQVVKELKEEDKFAELLSALNERQGTVIVFVRTKHRTERLSKQLDKNGHSAGRIHGDRSQSQRQATLGAFKDGTIRILVATDIAARGIDVANVAHVINYDIPNVPEEYIHRIGRTGRAGATGEALSFITPEVVEEWYDIQKLINPEGIKGTPRPKNAPKPERPQHPPRGRHPHSAGGPGHQNRQENRGGQNRGPRHDNRGAPNRGPRHDNRGNGGDFNRPQQMQQSDSGNGAAAAYDGDDEFFPQPTLEEQMTRIDREARGNRNGNRGNGPHRGGPNRGPNNRNNGPHRGGPHRGNPRHNNRNFEPGNRASHSAKPYRSHDDIDDNVGNRDPNGGNEGNK